MKFSWLNTNNWNSFWSQINYRWMFYITGFSFILFNNMAVINDHLDRIHWNNNDAYIQPSYPIVDHMVLGHHYRDENMLEFIHP